MKVFIVTHDVAYEGWRIVSVWTTREAAQRECERYFVDAGPDDYYDIEEIEVQP